MLGFIIGDCGAAVVILDSADYWRRLAPELADCPELKRVVVLAKPDEELGDDRRAVRAADWLAAAEGKPALEPVVEPQTSGGDRLHLGHHRPAERRDAVARQCRR